MEDNNSSQGQDHRGSAGTEHQNDKLDIGNDLSVGSGNAGTISDFDPDKDFPETEEKEHTDGANEGDDQRSDDNGINPAPGEVDPQKQAAKNSLNIENADEDKLNPYPDELKPDDDDEHFNSTWMMSGRNKKI